MRFIEKSVIGKAGRVKLNVESVVIGHLKDGAEITFWPIGSIVILEAKIKAEAKKKKTKEASEKDNPSVLSSQSKQVFNSVAGYYEMTLPDDLLKVMEWKEGDKIDIHSGCVGVIVLKLHDSYASDGMGMMYVP